MEPCLAQRRCRNALVATPIRPTGMVLAMDLPAARAYFDPGTRETRRNHLQESAVRNLSPAALITLSHPWTNPALRALVQMRDIICQPACPPASPLA